MFLFNPYVEDEPPPKVDSIDVFPIVDNGFRNKGGLGLAIKVILVCTIRYRRVYFNKREGRPLRARKLTTPGSQGKLPADAPLLPTEGTSNVPLVMS